MSRNSRFYNEDIVFLVEDELFKVDRSYFLENSPVFRDMLRIPQQQMSPDVGQEGESDTHPLNLQGIPKGDFACLLSIIYPKFPVQYSLTWSEWMAVLELATRWRMRALRLFCVEKLNAEFDSKPPIEKVAMARKFMATEWLVKAYEALVRRDALISVDDLAQLGQIEGFHLLHFQAVRMKDQMQKAVSHSYHYRATSFQSRVSSDFASEIILTFQEEILRLDAYDMDSKTIPSSPRFGFNPSLLSRAASPASVLESE